MINRLKIENWKNHRDIELEFYPRINSIVGNMGSGKSSILQAISFALFGTFSELKSKEIKTDELINRNGSADSSKITLEFSSGKDSFSVERKIFKNKLSEAVLKNKNGKIISGPQIQEVNSSIEKMLGINQNLWLRTVYARQNEIDYFLNVPPLRRKKEIDELMNLDRFEKARESCVRLSNILKNKMSEKSKILEDFDIEKIQEKMNELSLNLDELKKEKENIDSHLKTIENKKEAIREQLERKKEKVNYINKINERFSLIKEELEDLDRELRDSELKDKYEFENEIESIKTGISENQTKKQKIKEITEEKRSLLIDIEKQLIKLNEKIKEIKTNNERAVKLNEKLSEYENIEEHLLTLSKEIENKKSLINLRTGALNNLMSYVEELKKADSTCPVCSTRLDAYTKKRLILSREEKINAEEKEIELIRYTLKNLQKKEELIKSKDEERKKILTQLESLGEDTEDKGALVEEYRRLYEERSNLKENLEISEDSIKEIEKNLEELSERYINLQKERNLQEKFERRKKLEKELLELENKKTDESSIFEELEKFEEFYEKIIQKDQELRTRKEYISPLIQEKTARLEELNESKEEIIKIETEIKTTQTQSEFLNKFKNALIKAQGELRSELILAVNEIMGTIWQDIYPYDKWGGIKLLATEEDYMLQIKDVEGDWVSVAGFASGGERMIAALALRIAFAKILAPKLDLLILDEPTHNLDKNAIEKLTQMIEDKLSYLLTQTFIVTHEEKLAESAENLIKIKE